MTKNTKNNFSENAKMFMNPEYIANMMKQIPAPDLTKVVESAKRHGKTMEHASQIASKNFQNLIRKYAEMAQDHTNASLQLLQNVTSSTNPEEAVAHQQEFVKNTVDSAINNTREIIDLSTQSAMEIFNNLSNRVSEDLNDTFSNCCAPGDMKK